MVIIPHVRIWVKSKIGVNGLKLNRIQLEVKCLALPHHHVTGGSWNQTYNPSTSQRATVTPGNDKDIFYLITFKEEFDWCNDTILALSLIIQRKINSFQHIF